MAAAWRNRALIRNRSRQARVVGNNLNIAKLVLGGIVAVLSAAGLTITALMFATVFAAWNQKATGLGAVAGGWTLMLHSGWFWLAVFVIFAVGLFLSYRKLYF